MLAEQTRPPDLRHHEARVRRIPTHWLLRELERRGVPAPPASVSLIRVPRDAPLLEINRTWRTATWDGRVVGLTTRETDVLAVLAAAYPAPLSGPELGRLIWTTDDPPEAQQSARTYVHYLRRKLPGLIVTNWAGYRLDLGVAP